MRGERVESQGILTASGLYQGLASSGLRGDIASYLYSHEKAHADSDEVGRGEFGFIISSGWVVAYYLIRGERTPEQLMKIASAPGFSQMSDKDWQIYKDAWASFLRELKQEENRKKYEKESKEEGLTSAGLREMLIGVLGQKIDKLAESREFPSLEELLDMEFDELIDKYGKTLYQAYKEAIFSVKDRFGLYEKETYFT